MELNEISPYLAYGIRVYDEEQENKTDEVIGIFLNTLDFKHWSPENCNIDHYRMVCHPLSDLVKPCLEGGKIPIVELAKMAYGNIFHINEDFTSEEVLSEGENFGLIAFYDKERVSFTVQKECHWFEFCFYVDGSELHLNQLTLFQWMFEHHFWLGDQSRFGKDIIDINTITVK